MRETFVQIEVSCLQCERIFTGRDPATRTYGKPPATEQMAFFCRAVCRRQWLKAHTEDPLVVLARDMREGQRCGKCRVLLDLRSRAAAQPLCALCRIGKRVRSAIATEKAREKRYHKTRAVQKVYAKQLQAPGLEEF